MKETKELEYYEEVKDWDFSKFEIESETLTNWNLFNLINKYSTKESKILDLGTGGGEKVLRYYPECREILGTDFSKNKNLTKSKKENISFRLMDNLNMDVPDNYFDIVVARNTVTDPKQIYKCLKNGGYLFIHGVDKYDCHNLKLLFGKGQGMNNDPISIIDYENVINAGFKDVELVPIFEREYFKNKELFIEFLKKVPILDDFDEETPEVMHYTKNIDLDLLDEYIKENNVNGKIKLLRRYYGISARK